MKSRSFIATPPGATIKEQLMYKGISQKEFALRMDLSEKHISKLINGDVQLTPDVAVRLEMVLGVPAKFWNNLEATYREKLIKVKLENEMDADIELAKKIPYYEMTKYGWIIETRKPTEKVNYLRKYFEVVNLELIKNTQLSHIACRQVTDTEKSDYALLAWAQRAKIEARSIETSLINLKKLTKEILQIRELTTRNPSEFSELLISKLAGCGVALVFLPDIGGSFLHGATFCDRNKIVVGITVQGKDANEFWFSLFHELGHILLGHINLPNGTSELYEIEADDFARETLISSDNLKRFVSQNDFSKESVMEFANSNEILCSIVVDRLQKEGYIPSNRFNELKIKYE